jgi:DNA-binding LytR/AlgR family response regulator
MKIAVIDDERPSRSELAHLIRQSLPEADIREADSGRRAIELADEGGFDVFFVDVQLGDMDGTTLALILKKLQPAARIVFATAFDTYAVRAFELEAADYLLKPFDPRRVAQALARVTAPHAAPPAAPAAPTAPAAPAYRRISFLSDRRMVVVPVEHIGYIETDSRSCVVHTRAAAYTTAQPLHEFEEKLAGARFFRIHKSYLVNLDFIAELTPWFQGQYTVKLRGFERENLPVSRKQLRLLRDLLDG